MTAPQQLTPVQQAQLDLTNRMSKRTFTSPLYQQNQQQYTQTYGSSTPTPVKTPAMSVPQSVWADKLDQTGQYGDAANADAVGIQNTVQSQKAAADLKRWQDNVQKTQDSIAQSFKDFQKSMTTKYPNVPITYSKVGGGWIDGNGNKVDAHTAYLINNNLLHGLNADGSPKITVNGDDGMPVTQGQLIFQDPKDAQIASWARQAGWSESDIPMVIRIAQAESSRSLTATHVNGNGTTDYGLMQINTVHRSDGGAISSSFFTGGGWKDPVQNLAAALQIKNASGGWGPWSTFTNAAYKGYNPSYTTANPTINANIGVSGGVISAGTTGLRAQIVSKGVQYIGTPYVFGGNSLTQGVDCSGLVQQLYKQFGFQLPRTARQDANPSTWGPGSIKGWNYNTIGSKQQLDSSLMPGDLITFKGAYLGPNEFGHVAIYIGDGRILESPDVGLTVRVRDIRASEYKSLNMRAIHLELPGDHPPGWSAVTGERTTTPRGGGPRAT